MPVVKAQGGLPVSQWERREAVKRMTGLSRTPLLPDARTQSAVEGGQSRRTATMPAWYYEHATMSGLLSQLGPMSDATTNNVRVEVLSRYSPENSQPLQDTWVFQYTIRITNRGPETVQLLSRHWIITDAFDHIEEVQGPGVIGEQPILAQGESFKYSSWCPIKTPTGMMHGTYQMVRADGSRFDIEIAPFGLKAPYAVN